MSGDERRARFRILLRAGLVRRSPRQRPRSEGEMRAMGLMAARRWEAALASGDIVRTPRGYRVRPGWAP